MELTTQQNIVFEQIKSMGQRKSTGGVFYFIVFCIFAL